MNHVESPAEYVLTLKCCLVAENSQRSTEAKDIRTYVFWCSRESVYTAEMALGNYKYKYQTRFQMAERWTLHTDTTASSCHGNTG